MFCNRYGLNVTLCSKVVGELTDKCNRCPSGEPPKRKRSGLRPPGGRKSNKGMIGAAPAKGCDKRGHRKHPGQSKPTPKGVI
jgi:hypothetical protein